MDTIFCLTLASSLKIFADAPPPNYSSILSKKEIRRQKRIERRKLRKTRRQQRRIKRLKKFLNSRLGRWILRKLLKKHPEGSKLRGSGKQRFWHLLFADGLIYYAVGALLLGFLVQGAPDHILTTILLWIVMAGVIYLCLLFIRGLGILFRKFVGLIW